MKKRQEQGVALVITLILLSVITFMAVTFLVVSRHEGAQVDVVGQQTSAKFAADAAREEAMAQIVANMLANNNGLNFSLLVSTNFISSAGFINTGPTQVVNSLTNVSYTYPTGGLLTAADMPAMLNNQLILPRPPVFVATNANKNLPLDFRYYLDLNRNGVYDTNGAVLEMDNNGNLETNIYTGDPEWVGILNHPDQRHSSSNLYVGRYCFIAVPIGNSLDINYIHNQALEIQYSTGIDGGYLRNEGVGSWEINLAGFLNGLNPNKWTNYNYNGPSGFVSGGDSFNDAAAIVQARYGGSYTNMASFANLYPINPITPLIIPSALFGNDFIDGYSRGPLLTNAFLPTIDYDSMSVNSRPWSGSPNPNKFYTTQDLFNIVPVPPASPQLSFSNHLYTAGRTYGSLINNYRGSVSNSFNRYTFYRMLAQLGTDSSPEPAPWPYTNKINLNYNNLTTNVYSAASGNSSISATNFVPWTAIAFFTNAADRMLRQTFPNPVLITNSLGAVYTNYISITNIPIYPSNFYTPSIQRLLQLAANIYDASTYKVTNVNTDIDFPSVFRPVFDHANNIIRVSGYVEVGPIGSDLSFASMPVSLQDLSTNSNLSGFRSTANPIINIYGIPWIIGAKKGFPNFNQFDLMNVSQITRKLELIYQGGAKYLTNVQYTVGLSNAIGVQAWNSYTSSPYTNRSYYLYGFDSLSMVLSNEIQVIQITTNTFTSNVFVNPQSWYFPTTNGWKGLNIVIPFQTNYIFVSNQVGVYHQGLPQPLTSATNFDATGTNVLRFFPQLVLNTTNRLKYVMWDNATGRVLDYVQFDGMNFSRNLIGDLSPSNTSISDSNFGGVWRTNFAGGMTQGIANQIQISMGNSAVSPDVFPPNGWTSDSLQGNSKPNETNHFGSYMTNYATSNINVPFQAPFTPTALQAVSLTYQVNDPLVHYTLGDVSRMQAIGARFTNNSYFESAAVQPYANLVNALNPDVMAGISQAGVYNPYGRYAPWGASDSNSYNMALKDPAVYSSDAWQFPTNKYPNIGWLGRVHRGTPWQTVYLKPPPTNVNNWVINWAVWTGNPMANYYRNSYTVPNSGITTPGYPGIYDAAITMPTNDWALLDLFTTSPNDNASRGQLSVNQTNLAAWAAVLDGVVVLTNSSTSNTTAMIIDPTNATIYPAGYPSGVSPLQYLVNSINAVRASTNAAGSNIFPGGSFTSIGQLLSVPQLTVNSPFLNTNNLSLASSRLLTNADDVVERIPQQILSLLRVGSPRYVIYAYGQSLKPANNSIVQSGPYFGMCTNYQVTGEVATRTVLRIENYPVPGVTNSAGSPAVFRPRAVVESFNVLPPE